VQYFAQHFSFTTDQALTIMTSYEKNEQANTMPNFNVLFSKI